MPMAIKRMPISEKRQHREVALLRISFRVFAGHYAGLCEFIYVDVGIHLQGLDEYLGALFSLFILER